MFFIVASMLLTPNASLIPAVAVDSNLENSVISANADDSTDAKIQWFSTWQQGLAEADKTGRPILLVAAAPQCQGVPGVW